MAIRSVLWRRFRHWKYFFPVCLISEYASVTINVYLYSIHLGIWNVTAVFQFPFKIHTTLCSPNLELLTLSVRPFYLPRGFSNIVLCCVYVPLSADALAAADTIASYMQSMLLRYPDAPVFVMGDFNSCTLPLDTALPSFHQYVHVPTRNNKIIDLCYGNIPIAYSARAHPPLGRADHNVINLIPAYRQLLRRVKPTKVKVRQWTQDATMQLQGYLACTDWGVFAPDSVNLKLTCFYHYQLHYLLHGLYHSNENCDCLS